MAARVSHIRSNTDPGFLVKICPVHKSLFWSLTLGGWWNPHHMFVIPNYIPLYSHDTAMFALSLLIHEGLHIARSTNSSAGDCAVGEQPNLHCLC